MLAKIKDNITSIFLGDPVADIEEVYRTRDKKFSIHIGLFRNKADEIIWLKFVHQSFMTRSSTGIGITVDAFQDFADFLGSTRHKGELGGATPHKIPFFARVILAIKEGISQSCMIGEYRSKGGPPIVTRLYVFTNRRLQRRAVFEHKSPGHDIYEVFDFDVLTLLESEVAKRQSNSDQTDAGNRSSAGV